MSNDVKKILDMVLELSARERIELAEKVSASIPDEALVLSPAWREEIARRLERAKKADTSKWVTPEQLDERLKNVVKEEREARGKTAADRA